MRCCDHCDPRVTYLTQEDIDMLDQIANLPPDDFDYSELFVKDDDQ